MTNSALTDKKKAIWDDISSSFAMCGDIKSFPEELICNNDIPRLIYKLKVVLGDSLIEKFDYSRINLDLFSVICQGMVIALSMTLGLNEKYSIICADCYCCIRFQRNELKSTQYEQTYFSQKFISLFSLEKSWDSNDEKIQTFTMEMFNTILAWQQNPELHNNEINKFSSEMLANKI